LRINISLKFIPLEIPVPSAFENASFAANLFAKQFDELEIFLHFAISFLLKILLIKPFFF